MLRYAAYLLVFFSLFTGGLTPALAAKRVALVIGNSAYQSVPRLANPANDAAAVAEGLKRLGFKVEHRPDLDYRNFRRVLSSFSRLADGADVALIYYAGHGIEIDKRNYLVPVDAQLRDARDADLEALPLDVVLNTLEGASKLRLVILDACRNNPFRARMTKRGATRSVGRGLARVDAPSNTLVAYAAKEGTVAADGEGDHSPYTTALLKHLETPGLEINFLFRRVRDSVLAATGGRQEPFVYGSLSSEAIYLKPGPDAGTVAVPGLDALAVEFAYWQAAKDTATPQGYEVYLRKYPQGNFAPLVAIKLEELAQTKAREAQQPAKLGAAKKKQAEERARRAKQREELVQRLKLLEEQVKARAVAKKAIELKLAALQPPELRPKSDATATLIDPHVMALVLQNELRRVGCKPGKVDGKWSKQGRTALARFNVYAKLKLPTDAPTMDALEAVKGAKQRVCPLVCGVQFNKKDDQCVKKRCRSGKRLNSRGQCVTVSVKKPRAPSKTKEKSPFYKSPYNDCVVKWGEGYCRPLLNEG